MASRFLLSWLPVGSRLLNLSKCSLKFTKMLTQESGGKPTFLTEHFLCGRKLANRQSPIGNRQFLDGHSCAIKLRQTKATEVLVVASSLIFEDTNRELLAKLH